jgi:fatty acid desaturase
MKAHARPSTSAEYLGAMLGRAWRRWLQQERYSVSWLVSKGLSATVAKILPWVLTLVALGVLLHIASWLALLLLFGVATVWVAKNPECDDDEQRQPEWRNGVSGFGLYNSDGYRVDPHNLDDE